MSQKFDYFKHRAGHPQRNYHEIWPATKFLVLKSLGYAVCFFINNLQLKNWMCQLCIFYCNLVYFSLVVANVLIGLYLFEDKIVDPQDMDAFWIMVALVSAVIIVDVTMCIYFGFSWYYCLEKTLPGKGYIQIISSDDDKVSRKTPSLVRLDTHSAKYYP